MAHNLNENKHRKPYNQHRSRHSMLKQRLSREFRVPTIRSVAPQRYVGVSVCAAVLVTLAMVLIVPRTVRIRMTIYSVPSQAEIVVNGTRIGTTPVEVVLTRGTHTIEAQKDEYAPYRVDVSLPTIVSKNTYNVERNTIALYLGDTNVDTTSQDVDGGLISDEAQYWYNNIYEWSLTGTATADYHRPAIIQHAVQALSTSGSFADAWRIIESSVYDLTDVAALADWITAIAVASSPLPSPSSILMSILFGQQLLLSNADNVRFTNELLKVSPVYRRNAEYLETHITSILTSEWYKHIGENTSNQNAVAISQSSPASTSIQIAADTNNGTALLGTFVEYLLETQPTIEHDSDAVSSILVAQQPAAIQHFMAYLADIHQTEEITDIYQHYISLTDSIVSEQLSEYDTIRDEVALGLSLQNIEKYLAWVQERLPPPFQEYRVRLPHRHEMLLFSTVLSTPPSTIPAVWEWSQTTYHVQSLRQPTVLNSVLPITSPHEVRSVYSIQENEAMTGALPIDSQSPVTGFRIVLEKP